MVLCQVLCGWLVVSRGGTLAPKFCFAPLAKIRSSLSKQYLRILKLYCKILSRSSTVSVVVIYIGVTWCRGVAWHKDARITNLGSKEEKPTDEPNLNVLCMKPNKQWPVR